MGRGRGAAGYTAGRMFAMYILAREYKGAKRSNASHCVEMANVTLNDYGHDNINSTENDLYVCCSQTIGKEIYR